MSPAQTKAPGPRSVPAQRSSGPETMRGVSPGVCGHTPFTQHAARGPRPDRGESPTEPGRTFPGPLWWPLGARAPAAHSGGTGLLQPPQTSLAPLTVGTNHSRAPHARGGRAPGPAGTRGALPGPPRGVLTPSVPPRTAHGRGGTQRAVTPSGTQGRVPPAGTGLDRPHIHSQDPPAQGTSRSAAGWGPRLGLPRAWAAAAAPSVVNWIFPEPLSGESEIPDGAGAARTPLREGGGVARGDFPAPLHRPQCRGPDCPRNRAGGV